MEDSFLKEIEFDKTIEINKEKLAVLVSEDQYHKVLSNPINSFSINNIGENQNVTIVISDNTRKIPLNKMIRAVLETIGKHNKRKIRFVIATGTHKEIDPKILDIDDDIIANYAFYNHQSLDYMSLSYVGMVSSKWGFFPSTLKNEYLQQFYDAARDPDKYVFTEAYMKSPEKVFVNKLLVETDVVISIGGIKPHYFGGFAGGAKNLVPGCAGRHFILRNHFYKIHPSARIANLSNNIVRDELEEAAMLCHNLFNYNVVLGPANIILDVVAGHIIDSHRAGARVCRQILERDCSKYDVVLVTDTMPVTMSLKQIKKVVASACRVVRKNGVIIVYGECREGLGSDSRLNDLIFKFHLEAIKPEGVEVFICSTINRKDIRLSGFFEYVASLKDGIDYARKKVGRNFSIAHIPNGSTIIPRVVGD